MNYSLSGCDPRCWDAECIDCKCVCGGVNHGLGVKRGIAGSKSDSLKRVIKRAGLFWELQVIGSHFDWLYINRDDKNTIFKQFKDDILSKEPGIEIDIRSITKAQRDWPEVIEWSKRQREMLHGKGCVGDYMPMGMYKLIDPETYLK